MNRKGIDHRSSFILVAYGVNPDAPAVEGRASTRPFKRGTRTTGTLSGISAKGETGRCDEAIGGPPIG